MLNLYLRKPIRPPTNAPTTAATRITSGLAIGALNVLYPTVIVVIKPAASICPDTPILKSPVFKATATDNDAKIIGVQQSIKLKKSVSILFPPAYLALGRIPEP